MQVRLDIALVKLGFASTRSRAQFMIKSSAVLINDKLIDKGSHLVKNDDIVKVIGKANPWVSRAALKLEYAIDVFKLAPLRGVAMDIGASTGGFTEVILSYGCTMVYAIDVGRGQLNPKLKEDARIRNLEGVNAKDLSAFDIPAVDLIVCDASFISFKKVIKVPLSFGKENCQLIAIIKPQFEVGPEKVGKRGIVKESRYQQDACKSARSFLEQEGWSVSNLCKCPIPGSGGNVEFLIAANKKSSK